MADPGYPKREGTNLIFCLNSPEHCMKVKKIGAKGEGHQKFVYVDPPLITVFILHSYDIVDCFTFTFH